MTSRFNHRRLLIRLLIPLALVLALIPARAADEAHVRAVADMLAAVEFDKFVLTYWGTTDIKFPGAQQAMRQLSAQVTPRQVRERFAPVFAPHVDTRTARRIAAAPDAPQNRQAFQKLEAAAKSEAGALIWSWARNHHDAILKEATDATQRARRVMDQQVSSGTMPVAPAFQATGIAYIDTVMQTALANTLRQSIAGYQFNRAYEQIGVTMLIAPDRLVSLEHIDTSRHRLLRMEQALMQFEREAKAAVLAAEASYKAIDFAAEVPDGTVLQKSLMRGLVAQRSLIDTVSKNQRAMFDVQRRVLDFAATRQGKIAAQGNKLAVMGSADLALYTSLYHEVEAAKAAINAVAAAATTPQP